MPDSPDYSKYQLGSVRFSLQDMGELAARQWSPNWYQRLGNVAFMDDGSHGVAPYLIPIPGVSGQVNVVPVSEGSSGYSVQLQANAAGAKYASLTRLLSILSVNRHGLELGFSIYTSYLRFVWTTGIKTPTVSYAAQLNFDGTTGNVQIQIAGGTYVTIIPTWIHTQDANTFNHAKITYDLNTGKYIQLFFNQQVYDLSAYRMPFGAGSAQQFISILVELYGDGINPRKINIGTMIYTTDEP